MDEIVKKANYINPTDADEDFHREGIFSRDIDDLSADEAIKVFDVLAEKFTPERWPMRCDDGYMMLHALCKQLSSKMSDIDEAEMVEKVAPHILKACEQCVRAGLPSSLIDFMSDLLNLLPRTFFEDMPRERFLQVLNLIRIGCYKEHKNDNQADYALRNCSSPISRILREIEEETYVKHVDDLIDVTHYINMQILTGDEEGKVKYFAYFLYIFSLQCNRNRPLTYLKTDTNKLIEYLGVYLDLLEKLEVVFEDAQKVVKDIFETLYTLLRGPDAASVGVQLVPFTLSTIVRMRGMAKKQPWIQDIVSHLINGLRVDDKPKQVIYKSINMESIFPSLRAIFTDVDRETKEWEKNVVTVTIQVVQPACKTAADIQLLFVLIGESLQWRSKEITQRLKRETQDLTKPCKEALKSDNLEAFLGMLNQFRSLTSTIEEDEENEIYRAIEDSLDDWMKLLRSVKKLSHPGVQRFLQQLLCDIFASGVKEQASIGDKVARYVDWSVVESLEPILQSVMKMTSNESIDIEAIDFSSLTASTLSPMADYLKEKHDVLLPYLPLVGQALDVSLKGELYFDLNGSDIPSHHTHVLLNFFRLLAEEVTLGPMIEVIYPRLMQGVEVSEDFADFHMVWQQLMMCVRTSGEATEALCKFVPDVGDALKKAMKANNLQMVLVAGNMFTNLCAQKPLSMEKHVGLLVELLNACQGKPAFMALAMSLLRGLDDVAKATDKALTAGLLAAIMPLLKDQTLISFSNNLLEKFNTRRPELLHPHVEYLQEVALLVPQYAPVYFGLFERIVEVDKTQAERVMRLLEASVAPLLRSAHPEAASGALAAMNRIGMLCPEALAKRKPALEAWQREPTLRDMALHLLDAIAGRTLAGVDEAVGEQKERLGAVDSRLTTTEGRVDHVEGEVNEHAARIGNVEERTDETERRLDVVETDVNELDRNVEELDNKTMTNAPKWSRKVSELLNPESEHDWRLLAQRLGYSPADIRGWATQHDPCMAVLSEWFATNRTAGATSAVATALREINRLDALAVVEAAIKETGQVVSDGPEEYEKPPPVFLSYQWSHQKEAKLLRHHLELAGYRCWMDVGNMGGGDKLYEAIDRGLRGASVLVACVTEEYARSPNCQRELNLAAGVKKPIIPLQMERMQWPPAGSMGPLLSEYLFIRVFSKEAFEATVERPFWPPERFRELLMQVRMFTAPEHDLVRAPYERWWEPPEEVIVVPARKPKPGDGAAAAKTTQAGDKEAAPEVFLSYQWGRQEEVKRLYARLTGLGCSCWMDIFQMGGGDSLYDKIDRGIRACRAVVACVTPKYADSPNCRKEVSLSHALKKPIIPLMLEQTQWPPPGPMAMVFTELLYIGMHKAQDELNTWTGPRSDELFTKLRDIGVLPPAETKAAAPSGPPSGGPKESTANRRPSAQASPRPKSGGPPPAANRRPSGQGMSVPKSGGQPPAANRRPSGQGMSVPKSGGPPPAVNRRPSAEASPRPKSGGPPATANRRPSAQSSIATKPSNTSPPAGPKTNNSSPPEPPKTNSSSPPEPPKTNSSSPPEPPKTNSSSPPEPPKTNSSSPPEPPKTDNASPPEPPKATASPSEPAKSNNSSPAESEPKSAVATPPAPTPSAGPPQTQPSNSGNGSGSSKSCCLL